MNTETTTEVRFTAKRAARWSNGNQRWITISRETALELIALGAVDITGKGWV